LNCERSFVERLPGIMTYRARYTVGGDPRLYDVSLKTRNQEEAVMKLRQLVNDEEEERKGNIAPRRIRETAKRPAAELFAEYVADLRQRGRDNEYIDKVRSRLPLLFDACEWRTWPMSRHKSF
jgi:hypothetical protein